MVALRVYPARSRVKQGIRNLITARDRVGIGPGLDGLLIRGLAGGL